MSVSIHTVNLQHVVLLWERFKCKKAKRATLLSSRFAEILQNKLHIFVVCFTVARKLPKILTVDSSSIQIGHVIFLFAAVSGSPPSLLEVSKLDICFLLISASVTSSISSSGLETGKDLSSILGNDANRQDGRWLTGSPRYILFTHCEKKFKIHDLT